MRILLVNPFYPISETPSPPLGLAYLAAALEGAGHTVRLIDTVVVPCSRRHLADELNRFQPEIAGVTAVTMTVNRALEIVDHIKAEAPDVITVAGGPHVTFCAEQTLEACPSLDLVVVGEGEATVVDLADAVSSGRGLDTVNGLVYRGRSGIRRTAARPLIDAIDTIPPPARHLIPLGRYRALNLPVSMITSRGCPFRCIFCVGRKMVGSRVRYRNARAVVDEMAALGRLHFKQINLADDLFTASRRHCTAVCDAIIDRGLDMQWTAFARVDTVSAEMLEKMKGAGCTGVSFGVESGNAGILSTVKKGITLEQVVAAARLCTAAGVTPYASFILPLPGETPQTLAETLRFAERLKSEGVSYGFHLLAPFPGTAVREKHRAYGLRILTDDWRQYHANRAIVETESVSAKMLDAIVTRWEDEYNDYLGDIARRMADGTISAADADPLISLERTVMLYDLMMAGAIEALGPAGGTGRKKDTSGVAADLARRLQPISGKPADKIADAVRWALDRGHLVCRQNQDGMQWQWMDRL